MTEYDVGVTLQVVIEADGKIINKLFPYSFTGFMDACDWFDEQRATYRFARLIASQRG